ncbi:MAG TPA: hypothetical protein VIC08_15975 [Cellvibrionaceae bacterium]
MVYLGPITRLTPVSKPKPATGYEPDRDLVVDHNLPEKPPVPVERRKADRRQDEADALLDSRSGKDRRRSRKIDIEI